MKGSWIILLSLTFLFSLMDFAAAETKWINNITVNEYNITWGYKETFTGLDSRNYRINIDSKIGNNDSFINAWELLKADKEERKTFKSSLENETDIEIDNGTYGIELMDIDSLLSQTIIGKVNINDTIENRFNITYRLSARIFDSSSIRFFGKQGSPITIIFPEGIDIISISGMDNESKNIDTIARIEGYFPNKSKERGEISINFKNNESFFFNKSQNNITETATPEKSENITEPAANVSRIINKWSIAGIGILLIALIYFFKVRHN